MSDEDQRHSADYDAGVCGKPRRYFPQQTCELPFGHDGEHEDATRLWSNP